MMRTAARDRGFETSRQRGTVAVVTRRALEFQLARDLYADERDLVLIGSVNDAYSQIRRVAPDLIVVYLSGNDVEGCRLLSMLALDRETSTVPVVTYLSPDTTTDDASDVVISSQGDTVN
jgi:DNA-binding response OmpR family regulator